MVIITQGWIQVYISIWLSYESMNLEPAELVDPPGSANNTSVNESDSDVNLNLSMGNDNHLIREQATESIGYLPRKGGRFVPGTHTGLVSVFEYVYRTTDAEGLWNCASLYSE